MMTMLDKRTYLVKEHVGLLKLHEAFDVLDPETGEILGTATEEASAMRKLLKLVVNKSMLPFSVHLTDPDGNVVLTITRGMTFLRSKVKVLDARGDLLGTFRQKLLSIGGRFELFNATEEKVAEIKGNLIGWNFKFIDVQGKDLGQVTKKWAGIGKEFLTSADNYVVSLAEGVDPVGMGPLLLAAALCIDMVLKDRGS